MPLTVMVRTFTGAVPASVTRLRFVLMKLVAVLKTLDTVFNWPSRNVRRWPIQLLMPAGLARPVSPPAWNAAYFASRTASTAVPAPVWKKLFTPSASAPQ